MNTRRLLEIVFGTSLVLMGGLLLAQALGIDMAWTRIATWVTVALLGGSVALSGWIRKSSFKKFLGAVLVVGGSHAALWSAQLFAPLPEEMIASVMIWIGLGFAFVWCSAPYKLDLLVPTVLFLGPGVGYYLWWYDLVRAATLRAIASNGWPVLIVLLGAGILVRTFRPARQ